MLRGESSSSQVSARFTLSRVPAPLCCLLLPYTTMPTAVVQVTRGTTKAYVTDRKRKPGASLAVEGVPDPPTGTPSKRRKPSEPAASRARGVDLSRGSELTLKPSSD